MIMKQILPPIPQLEVLQESDLTWLASIAQHQSCMVGSRLIEAGQTSDSIYLLLSGRFATLMNSSAAEPDNLVSISTGDFAGETALLDNRPASTTIKAIEAAEVLVIPRQQLAEKLVQDKDFAGRFYHLMAIKLSGRLRELSNLMAQRQIKEGEPLRKVLMVFATLNDSDISWMIANGTAEKAALGSTLIQQNQSVPAVYLLLEGMLGIYIAANGQNIEVAKRVKGDILGEMSFVDGGTASATVKTLENAWVLGLPQSLLSAKLQEDRGFASRFYRAIAQILSTRCQDLLIRGGVAALDASQINLLSEDIEVEDEIDLDVLEGTAIAGRRFDWLLQRLRR
jgi:bacteriocin-type transport-associated protein